MAMTAPPGLDSDEQAELDREAALRYLETHPPEDLGLSAAPPARKTRKIGFRAPE